ncbi:MAG: metal ABC transporter permease [Porticoccaceae bacterium]|jgi:zinc transport system permease protein|nr:metal ABC transporter permease [Porticoccaceae bacterium]
MFGLEFLQQEVQAMVSAGKLPFALYYEFVINAILCALIIGPVLGALGTMVVAKRMAFFSQAVGNAALTGVAIGVLIGESYTSPYVSMFSFCILFALLLNFTRNHTKMSSDTLIGVFLSISLAMGASLLLFISARVNTHILESILFGSILTVNQTDIAVLFVVSVLVVGTGYWLFNRMLLSSLNPALAHVRGVRVQLMEYIFVLMITLVTVACVKIIGAVLVEALLLIPAAAARNLNRSLGGFMLWSVIFSVSSCLMGIIIPMQFDIPIPSGGAIILSAACFFLITSLMRGFMPQFKEARI